MRNEVENGEARKGKQCQEGMGLGLGLGFRGEAWKVKVKIWEGLSRVFLEKTSRQAIV